MAVVLPALPVLVPLLTAAALVMVGRRPRMQAGVSLAGAGGLFAAAVALLRAVQATGPLSVAFGNWPAPFGIEFTADLLGAAMTLLAAAAALAVLLFRFSDAGERTDSPQLLPLVHLLLAGVGGAFLTADLFNLYVWFELALVSAVGLLGHGGEPRHLEATLKYFVLNALGTLLLLVSIAALYAITGQLNFNALRQAITEPAPAALLPALALLMTAVLIKCAAFPVSAWLPASYHTLPTPIAALFAALLTKVGVYAVLRLLGDVFAGSFPLLIEALGWIAAATMLFGVLGAAWHWDIRRILAFHSISQIGYILLGIALATTESQAGAIFYSIHHSLVKGNLFLVAAIICRISGSYDLRRCGGLATARPWLAGIFALSALSLVGIPPLSGFWAKLAIVRAALVEERYLWAVFALGVGFLTLYSMLKIWLEAFWKAHPDPGWAPPADTRLMPAYLVTAALAGVTVVIGLAPGPLLLYGRAATAALGRALP